MSELNSDTVLKLAPSLTIDAGETTMIHVGEKKVAATPNVFSILEVFARPTSYGEAVKRLSSKLTGTQAWVELVSNIRTLHSAGVLVDGSAAKPQRVAGWAAPQIHVAMLNDRQRTAAFLSAIKETVRPDDVVIDIGTGTGVLAVGAAKAGAKRVYAIEATDIGRIASKVFEANNVADRVTLIPGRSLEVDLPEKATVLVAEIIGNDPLDERVIETFADARVRLLAPGARILPQQLQIMGVAVEVHEPEVQTHSFTSKATARWHDWYGIDFTPLDVVSPTKSLVVTNFPRETKHWPQLSDPVLLADLDLRSASQPVVNEKVTFDITRAGRFGGFLVYFELEVGAGQHITTSPQRADEACSWRVATWLQQPERAVKPGDKFNVSYRYRVDSTGSSIAIEAA